MPRKSNSHPLVWGFNRYTIFSVYINRIKHKELHTNNEKLSTACTNWSSKGSVEEKKKAPPWLQATTFRMKTREDRF